VSGPRSELVPAPRSTGCWAAGTGWSGQPFSSAQLRFRVLDTRDVSSLIALTGGELGANWTGATPHQFGELEAHNYITNAQQENRVAFAIEALANDKFIGCIRIDRGAEKIGDLGYCIAQQFWGHGYCGEALKRVVRFAFEQAEVNAIKAEVRQGNATLEALLIKAGFSKFSNEVDYPRRFKGLSTSRFELSREDWLVAAAAKPTVLVVAVAMVDPDGRVLMARRPEGKPLAGLWEFPGGKVGDGETPEVALIRELHEELGVDTRSSCLAPFTFASHEYEDFHLLMPLYVCRVWQGHPLACEGQELAWVRPQRMRDYPMPPADEPLVAMLCELL